LFACLPHHLAEVWFGGGAHGTIHSLWPSDGRWRVIGDLIVGLIGAFIGDWLLPQLGVHFGTGIVALIINAFIGAVILLLILRLVGGGWGYRRSWGRRWR
jgi:uncharacterized membrane protein YeaQ/YmgE (transglycosylase-associated protein family)